MGAAPQRRRVPLALVQAGPSEAVVDVSRGYGRDDRPARPRRDQGATAGGPKRDREARREAILDAAQEVFLTEGFAAASMSAIAAKVGGSKGTLYTYFKSKRELFRAYVERRCLWPTVGVFELKADEAPLDALHRVARVFLAYVLDDGSMRNFRLVTAEAERAPHIGQMFYEIGPKGWTARLADFLVMLEVTGLLDVEGDALAAAQHLLALVQNPTFNSRLCNAAAPLHREQIDAAADRGVRVFLRAYGA